MESAATTADEIPTPKPTADQAYLTDIGSLSPQYADFARALAKCGDTKRAYLATHPKCNNQESAKRRGRAIAKLPGVVAYLARIKVAALGIDGEKEAWEHELRSIAYAGVNLKKVPVKEKVSALRTLGESKGWLKRNELPVGLRATFNFRIGSEERTITVEQPADQMPVSASSGAELTASPSDPPEADAA